jgi:malate dehydrogenase (oxaloacetate-decarboxylating)(NADP+)
MIKNMAKNPIVFALANPNPEIDYNLAISVREDLLWQPEDQIIPIR